jgi:hypothetical protein
VLSLAFPPCLISWPFPRRYSLSFRRKLESRYGNEDSLAPQVRFSRVRDRSSAVRSVCFRPKADIPIGSLESAKGIKSSQDPNAVSNYRVLDEACPQCGRTGSYRNIGVGRNSLRRRCDSCKALVRIELPPTRKRVLYLDQFFLSNAFKNSDQRYLAAASAITSLVQDQLLVCPWSDVHELETKLWPSDRQQSLWSFIKRSAAGHKFSTQLQVHSQQLHRAFTSFCANGSKRARLEQSDALEGKDLHDWSDYIWIDIPLDHLIDVSRAREEKENTTRGIVGLFEAWRNAPGDFHADVTSEALGMADAMFRQYLAFVRAFGEGDAVDWFAKETPAAHLISSLMHRDAASVDPDKRMGRMREFLMSEYFRHTPYIEISCSMFAGLRGQVRSGHFSSDQQKAAKKLAGFHLDVDFISTFGPYCDALFIDKSMHHLLRNECSGIFDRYPMKLFSLSNFDEFLGCLAQWGENRTDEHMRAVRLAYPGRT